MPVDAVESDEAAIVSRPQVAPLSLGHSLLEEEGDANVLVED